MLLCLFNFSANGQVDWPTPRLVEIVRGIDKPTYITHAGDGSGRLFLTEQQGRVWIVTGTNLQAQPFLDIRDRVYRPEEMGLLSLVFPPGAGAKTRFYVSYTRLEDGATDKSTIVSRFQLSSDSDVADPSGEQVLLAVGQPTPYHNGGQIAFGPDGYLYIGRGDGGISPSANNEAQNPASLLGKILRIAVEGVTNGYSIPTNNPFVSNPAYRPEIWALGLRNPWRFSFDRLTGDLYIGDVGQYSWEEINFQSAGSGGGQNYGWRMREGNHDFIVPPGFDLSSLTPPVTEYPHRFEHLPAFITGSVTGGFVYRGPDAPRMNGLYFFADYMSGRIWAMTRQSTNWIAQEIGDTSHYFTTFGEDEQGRLYLADYSGIIYRLEDSGQAVAPEFDPPTGGLYQVPQDLRITSPTPGAVVHYTTEFREPTESDPVSPAGQTLLLDGEKVFRAKAYRSDLAPSETGIAGYNFMVARPEFNPPPGPVANGTVVTITCVTPGAEIRYSIDGGTNWVVYSQPLTINGGTTLLAYTTKQGYQANWFVVTASYPLAQLPPPEFRPSGGAITNGTLIAVIHTNPAVTIRYTLDGTEPGTDSTVYTEPIRFTGYRLLVGAKAFLDTHAPSYAAYRGFGALIYDKALVSTVAGAGNPGWRDGSGTNALFEYPTGIVMDSLGNLLVGAWNGAIRKINPGGEVTTLVNPLTNTAAVSIYDLCVEGETDLAFTAGDNRIWRWNPTNGLSLIAGTNVFGYRDGPAAEAEFAGLRYFARDNRGNHYVTDRDRIRRIGADGIVSTVVSNTPPNNGAFDMGWNGLTISQTGELFCPVGSRVYRVRTNGEVTVFVGDNDGGWDGPGGLTFYAQLVREAAFDSLGNLYVCVLNVNATNPSWIRKIRPDGMVTTLAGHWNLDDTTRYRDGPSDQAVFSTPYGLCVGSDGTVYVADTENHVIRKIVQFDWDDDGIPDAQEGEANPYVVGVDDRRVDSDGDGFSNASEFVAGTNPLDAESLLRLESKLSATLAEAALGWPTVTGRNYQMQRSLDLVSWQNEGGEMTGSGGMVWFTNALSQPEGRSFYRVSVQVTQ